MIAPDSFNYCLGPGPQFIICWTIALLPLIELCAAASAHHKEQVFVPPLGTYLINPPFHTEGKNKIVNKMYIPAISSFNSVVAAGGGSVWNRK